jgi:hypothetical protein
LPVHGIVYFCNGEGCKATVGSSIVLGIGEVADHGRESVAIVCDLIGHARSSVQRHVCLAKEGCAIIRRHGHVSRQEDLNTKNMRLKTAISNPACCCMGMALGRYCWLRQARDTLTEDCGPVRGGEVK